MSIETDSSSPYSRYETRLRREVSEDEAHDLLDRIAKDRGLPLQDERIAVRTRANRTDSRALVNFALSFGNAPTKRGIVNYLNRRDFKERGVVKEGLVDKALTELVEQDLVKRSLYGRTMFYEPHVYTDGVGIDSAYLTNISIRYPVHLGSIFGEAEPASTQMPSRTGEVRDGIQYTLDRVNTLLYLDCLGQLSDARMPLTVTQSDIADTLNIRPDSLKRHLRSLDKAGVVTYHSVNTGEGSYQAYRPVDISGGTPNSPVGWVRTYARQNGGIVTPEGVASFYFDGLTEDVSEAERDRFTYQVRRSLHHMGSTGEFAKVAPFGDMDKSEIRLEPRTFQRNLIGDLAATFAAMQTPTREARAYGLEKGRDLTRNWRGITRILDKVEADNSYYIRRMTPQP